LNTEDSSIVNTPNERRILQNSELVNVAKQNDFGRSNLPCCAFVSHQGAVSGEQQDWIETKRGPASASLRPANLVAEYCANPSEASSRLFWAPLAVNLAGRIPGASQLAGLVNPQYHVAQRHRTAPGVNPRGV